MGRSDIISNKSEGREKKERGRGEVTLLLLHLPLVPGPLPIEGSVIVDLKMSLRV